MSQPLDFDGFPLMIHFVSKFFIIITLNKSLKGRCCPNSSLVQPDWLAVSRNSCENVSAKSLDAAHRLG